MTFVAVLPLEFICPVDIDRIVVVVKVQHDGQRNGRLSGGKDNDKQGDQLAVEPQ